MKRMKVGIIGGSGLDDPDILTDAKDVMVDTPFGPPSDLLKVGKIHGIEVVLLARHGRKHTINPSNVNYRANIYALKEQGCTHIVAATAVGSLKEDIPPGTLVVLDQFIDRTTKREQSFYDMHKVCHIPMAHPFCPTLRHTLYQVGNELSLPMRIKGTVVTIEGPRFSSKAESLLFRSWNADVINMSSVPEVVLAREAGLCYASIAMSTDFDCWHESEHPVTIEMVLSTMKKNAENVKKLLVHVISKITDEDCQCRHDIEHAVI